MQFLNPLGLLLLGLIPILLLIHSFKPKAKQVTITNLFLWQEALQEQQSGMRIKKLLQNIPLIFQILIVLLASLALFQPIWLFEIDQQYRNMIIILDTSASMKTQVGNQTRFDYAQEKALDLIGDLPSYSQALIIESGIRPNVKINFTDDKQKLASIINDIEPTETPGNLTKAVFLALSFLKLERRDHIFVITDGAGGEIDNITGVHQNITPLLIEGGHKNVGITKFQFREELSSQNRYQVLLEIKNFNSTSERVPLRLTINDKLIAEQTFNFKPEEKKLLFFSYSGSLTGIAKARIEVDDDFSIDNQAQIILNSAQQIKVLLVTPGNHFLESLLSSYPNFTLQKTDKIDPASWNKEVQNYDIVVIDRVAPPSTQSGNFLLIDAFSPDLPFVKGESLKFPSILDWNRNHSIMTNLDLWGIQIDTATHIILKENIDPLLESEKTGLLYAYEKRNLRVVQFAFDFTQSDLPFQVTFPLLMNNVFRWLHPKDFDFSTAQVKAGSPYQVALRTNVEEITIRTPSGKQEKYQWGSLPLNTGMFQFTKTDEVGVYELDDGRNQELFAVSLLDESESNIRVPKIDNVDMKLSGRPSAIDLITDPLTIGQSLWFFLFFAASLFLAFEWYFWNKQR